MSSVACWCVSDSAETPDISDELALRNSGHEAKCITGVRLLLSPAQCATSTAARAGGGSGSVQAALLHFDARLLMAQNATFGNVVELILSLAALQKGLYDVVAMSLIGSVLSNLLLVLGAEMLSFVTRPFIFATRFRV